ncbi:MULTISPECIES: DNA phosphorothioation-dependent restriction protein DptG [unclassified Viridibacillus]|uniref:DNA phosphorothioation-dependent restriction protein DptG n=1 Tax=unclassified Viridibacillus TaxID=2617942 RepID=UPI00096FFB28|nr:DNA phosphorothioation-dependent restriction protein DptG [Viridibacillus sp. FSL H8-0123]OMC78421.1 DNA phosphorothioation-dependent restriction protein DptG [Viridibacillus sp. FSL H8-0123]
MTFQLDTQKIKDFVEKNGAYTYRRRANTYVLPLPTRKPERAKFENGYVAIVGATLRVLDGENLEYEKNDDSIDSIIDGGKFDSAETEEMFKLFIENELKDIENSTITRVEHFKNIPFIDHKDEKKGEIGFFHFFYDLYIRDNEEEFQEIFSELKSEDLLSEIIRISVEKESKSFMRKYKMLFPGLKEQFLQDVRTLASNPAFLIQHFADLALHYTFIAMAQIVIQTNKITFAQTDKLHRIVFLNMSEKGSKRRDFYNEGLRLLREEIRTFFAHEHTLNVLGNNTFIQDGNWFYKDYADFFEKQGPDAQTEFIQSIYYWINEEYVLYFPSTQRITYEGQDLQTAFRDLYDTLRKNVKEEINSRYSVAFETIATRFYRKAGGSLGNILALNLDQIIALIAVSVGPRGNQLELNKLWIELEVRGVFFDKYSKEEVVKMLDNLNYLDKKSDSGDAQYVKAIL